MIEVGFKRLTDDAVLPVRAHYSDSGFDLFANEDVVIEPGETEIIRTGIAVHLPPGYEAQVRPRSGVTSKTKLRVQLGTIDNAYVGEVGILVDNIASTPLYIDEEYANLALLEVEHGRIVKAIDETDIDLDSNNLNRYVDQPKGTYLIRKGDKLAQLVIQALPQVHAYEIEELPTTIRGTQGFGSSGY